MVNYEDLDFKTYIKTAIAYMLTYNKVEIQKIQDNIKSNFIDSENEYLKIELENRNGSVDTLETIVDLIENYEETYKKYGKVNLHIDDTGMLH